VSKFLNNGDCASVSYLNQEYSKKTWIVILNCATRVNEYIKVNEKSWSWIVKYKQHLKFQKLKISHHHKKFFQLHISAIDTLLIRYCDIPIRIPQKIQKLQIEDCCGNLTSSRASNDVSLNGLTSFVFLRCWEFQEFDQQTLPSSLIYLYLQCVDFNVTKLPTLPNLTTLTLHNCDDFYKMDELHIKCPNIQNLIISQINIGYENLNGLQGLQINRLVIDCPNLISLDALQFVKVDHLLLKNCQYVSRFEITKLVHIPDIKVE
jgi:hypothetical protein